MKRIVHSAHSQKKAEKPCPLHFHYEDVLRQDLLLKLNHANVMEVPGLFEIRLVPKAASDFRIQFGGYGDFVRSEIHTDTKGPLF